MKPGARAKIHEGKSCKHGQIYRCPECAAIFDCTTTKWGEFLGHVKGEHPGVQPPKRKDAEGAPPLESVARQGPAPPFADESARRPLSRQARKTKRRTREHIREAVWRCGTPEKHAKKRTAEQLENKLDVPAVAQSPDDTVQANPPAKQQRTVPA